MLSAFKGHEAELKSQGVVEAAQDPESNVTAADASRVIVEEAKKAQGAGAAFEFDPDASPEEKAAQARSHIPDDFHHVKRTKAVELATDIDDGTPDQYDLPPPTTAGVIEIPRDADGNAKQTNGVLPQDERAAADRTGWVSKFGAGSTKDEEGTLLDHQTFLEGKLDDKLFGDWYHNAAVIVFACLSSWVIALLGGGLGWVLLIMATCGSYYRTSLRRVRRNFRDDVNREMAKSRLETDTESLEWINSFLVKFWPIYQPVLAETIINSVDQVLSTSTPAFLDSLRLRTFTLGSKPPRLEHVKTYPKADDDIVLMDWKFSFTPNDTMDLTARQLKTRIQPKVVLEVRIGKAMISKGLDVIVEDFAFSGLMRVKVKLQIPFPHVDRIDICFLERPEIDYVCKPLGGDTLGFDINFVPGLEGFIKEQIHGNLQPIMYEPNVFPIEIAKMLSGNAVNQAIGVVAITLHHAHGLKNQDKFSGTPDPYVAVSLDHRAVIAKTKTITQNANPRWNETLYIIITSFTEALTLHIFDYNEFRKDKDLGTATFPLDQLEHVSEHENLQLEVVANGKSRGLLQADIRFFPVLSGIKGEDGHMEPPPESNTGIARFTVEQAKELDGTKSVVGQLSPYAALLLNGKEIHVTGKLKRTNNPVFPDASKEFLVTDRKTARLGLVIKDDRDLASDPILGTYQIKLNDMIQLMEKGQEWFHLGGAKQGRAKLTLDWKPVALKGAMGTSGGYITPIGVMRIHFQNARNLRNVETVGKSDPYARVLLSGIEKGRTVTFQNDLNPDWDEVMYVPMHSPREKLTLEVMDAENLGKDRSLGSIEISAADFIHESAEGGFEVHDTKAAKSDGLRLKLRGQTKGALNYTVAFYPTLNVADPEEEEEERKAQEALEDKAMLDSPRNSGEGSVKTAEKMHSRTSTVDVTGRGSIDTTLANTLSNGEKQQGEMSPMSVYSPKKLPKIHIGTEDIAKYESGLLVFKVLDGALAHSNVQLEVLMDDMVFPSFTSSRARSRTHKFGETGDAFAREIDVSRITLRLTQKTDKKGEEEGDHVIAKLTGATLQTLQSCLYKPTELSLRGTDGQTSKITVSLKYLPVKMQLDPSESINNMGTLRVDILDAADLPSADRNGFSDPYCKFRLNGKDIYKTKVQKKTLHPAWNEFFECQVKSRTGADFKCDVYDWDFGDKADHLGTTTINLDLLEPFQPQELAYALDGKSGTIRLKMLFKPDYVIRSRQGSSTFSGTFAPAGKVIGAPVKGIGMVGGGVVKGASFLTKGFRGKKTREDTHSSETNGIADPTVTINGEKETADATPQGTPQRAAALTDGSPTTPMTPPQHSRARSFASTIGGIGGISGNPGSGTASITVVSAEGYPSSANVRVSVKMLGPKGAKEIHKTKSIKAASGKVEYGDGETFKVSCSPDTQFQVHVKDHGMFGGGDDLGEALFFVQDQGAGGSEKEVKAGAGSVMLKSTFAEDSLRPETAGGAGKDGSSPETRKIHRRSFLSKRDVSRGRTTPPG